MHLTDCLSMNGQQKHNMLGHTSFNVDYNTANIYFYYPLHTVHTVHFAQQYADVWDGESVIKRIERK